MYAFILAQTLQIVNGYIQNNYEISDFLTLIVVVEITHTWERELCGEVTEIQVVSEYTY